MVKVKTSAKQKTSLKKQLFLNPNAEIREQDPLAYILDEDNIARGILECLKNNDPEGIVEILGIYLNAQKRI